MTVSVIIPVYQAERFIQKAVLSVCEQEEVSEIILVEDNSSDNSLKICEGLALEYPSLVKLYRHEDGFNHGAGASRNYGIKKAKGLFIAFLDADDYYLPDRFKRDLEILHSDPLIDGCYNATGVHIYDEDERERINFELTTVTYPIPPEILFENMAPVGISGYFHGDALTVRKDIFNKVGLFDESLELCQDTHMWFKMAAKARIASGIIDKSVAIRGVHSGNRIKDIPKSYRFRELLFISLMRWGKVNKLSMDRRNLLWDCLYLAKYNLVNHQNVGTFRKKISIFLFLLKHGITNPYVLFHRQYYYSFITGIF